VSERILVIKLSALGDFVLSIGSFQAIRAHHPRAHITLLTTAPFAELGRALGCFDAVWIDSRPPLWRPGAVWALTRRLRGGAFTRVYDLQRSQRTGWYFRLAGRPPWVGTVAGCTWRYVPPPDADTTMHILERETAQLALAGVPPPQPPELSALAARADITRFALPERFALLIPGSAPHRPLKRWPAARYAALAGTLAAQGTTPVLIGGAAEQAERADIIAACPRARDLGGQTDLFDLIALGHRARLAVGNDTGPTHVIAATGCPTLVLFSRDSHPVKSRPPWPAVRILRRDSLAELPFDEVLAQVHVLAKDG